MVEINWSLFIQILNILLWVGIIYFVFKVVILLPKRLKSNEEKIEKIEKLLEEINRKLDK